MDYTADRIDTQREEREVALSALWRNALGIYVQQNPADLLTTTRSKAGHLAQITPDVLRAANIVTPSSTTTGIGRNIDLWLYAPSSHELYYFARAYGDLPRIHLPKPRVEHGEMGVVGHLKAEHIIGPGVHLDVSAIRLSNPALMQDGDLVALGLISAHADIAPYLSRTPAVVGGVNMNTMETNLDMGGHDITATGDIDAKTGQMENLTTNSINMNGALSASDMTVTNLTATGTFTARAGTITGPLSANSATITGDVSAQDVTVNGTLTAGDVNATGTLSAPSATVTGTLKADIAKIGTSVSSETSRAGTLETNTIAVTGAITSGTAVVGEVTTGSCSGC